MLETTALITSIILPFFNIPLIYRISKRRSAEDVSAIWSIGVFVCFIIIEPYALLSGDIVFAVFNSLNIAFFIIINILIFRFRRKKV